MIGDSGGGAGGGAGAGAGAGRGRRFRADAALGLAAVHELSLEPLPRSGQSANLLRKFDHHSGESVVPAADACSPRHARQHATGREILQNDPGERAHRHVIKETTDANGYCQADGRTPTPRYPTKGTDSTVSWNPSHNTTDPGRPRGRQPGLHGHPRPRAGPRDAQRHGDERRTGPTTATRGSERLVGAGRGALDRRRRGEHRSSRPTGPHRRCPTTAAPTRPRIRSGTTSGSRGGRRITRPRGREVRAW